MTLALIPAPAGNDPALRQLAAIQGIGGAVAGFGQIRDRELQRQALVDALAGQPGQMGPGGMGPPTAPTPGLLPGLDRRLIEAMVLAGGGDALVASALQQQFPAAGEGFSLEPGEIRYDASGKQVAAAPAATAEAEAPKMRDRLVGNERLFEQFDPAAGRWVELSRGPAFAPPAVTNIDVKPVSGPAATVQSLAPGAIADLTQIHASLIDPQTGGVNRQLLTTMNVPGLDRAVPGTAGAQLRSGFEGALDLMVTQRTGATATESQMANMRTTYMPSPLDDDATVRAKLERFDRDLRAALEVAGRGHPGAPQAPTTSAPPVQPSVVDRLIEQGTNWLQGGEQAAPSAPAPGAVDFTWQDVELTAREEGLTEQQVLESVAKSRGVPVDQIMKALGGR
jgi:hypothetical protein